MYLPKKTILLILAIFYSFAALAQGAPAYELATDIADHYVKSFPSEGRRTEESTQEVKAHETQSVHLDEKKKREVVFNSIFTKSKDYTLTQEKMAPILNKYSWGDLNLFYGTTSTPAYHLMNRINRADTLLGEGVLATMLVTPSSNIQELKKRQRIIQAFLGHQEVVSELKSSLQYYQKAEESLFSLWTPTDPLYTKDYQKYMNDYFYSKNDPAANKSAGWLEFNKRLFRDFLGIQYRFLWPVTTPTIMEIFVPSKEFTRPIPEFGVSLREFWWKGAIPYYGGWFRWDIMKGVDEIAGNTFAISGVLSELTYTWTAYSGISNYLEFASVLRNLALRMADVQAFVLAATEVSECIAASPELEAVYGDKLERIRELLDQSEKDTELGRLVYYLQTLPYSSWSYFFNNAGKLLASHKLFTEHKDEFADAMYALGELDAFLSVTTLVQEAKDSKAKNAYTFTKFLDRNQKSKPYIKLANMWNPFLEADIAVDNSVEMDAAKGVQNIILTGPNAGGKSTFLTGVTTSLLLSQTFGIAPAKEAVITPFDKINTYIDIADDIAAGKSLFMSEVDRAQEHLKMLTKLKKNEFSFTIFDEPFSGTNPTEGAAAEYSILESMADYTNTLNIVATHYPIVMLLEKKAPGKGFRNYKVYIKRKKGQKKIGYTYKVIPGKSTQAIAIDILEEQGYDTRLLKRAREIIKHPERYTAEF